MSREPTHIKLREVPALTLAVSAAVGVASALYIAILPSTLLMLSAPVFVFALIFVVRRARVVGFTFVCLFFLMMGAYRASDDLARAERQAVAVLGDADRPVTVTGRVAESPHQAESHWSVLLARVELSRDDTTIFCRPLRVRVIADSASLALLQVNDLVSANGRLYSAAESSRRSVGALTVSLTDRIVATVVADSNFVLTQVQSGFSVSRETEFLRDKIIVCFNKNLNLDASALCKALVLGERGDFSAEFSQALRMTGLSHIFALSGMNVGFLVVLVWLLLSAMCLPRTLRLWALLLFILLYLELGREEPSLVRACLMAGLFVGSRLLQRNASILNIVLAAAFIELLWRPLDLISAGFVLSYLAVLGILLGFEAVHEQLLRWFAWAPRGFSRGWADVAAATIVTQLATVPMQTAMFGRLPLLGLAGNLLAVPAFAILLLWSVLLLLVAAIAPPLALLVGSALNIAAFGLGRAIEFFASLPLASLNFAPLSMPFAIIFLLSVFLVLAGFYARRRQLVFGGILAAVNGLVWAAVLSPHVSGSITFLDVGNGDAALISSSTGRHILVDAGPHYGDWSAATRINQYFAENRIAVLDAIILTHNDEDHIGGCADVLSNTPTKVLFTNKDERETLTESEIEIIARSKQIRMEAIVSGRVMNLTAHERICMLWPDSATLQENVPDNRKSVVLLVEFGGACALLTGDADSTAEHELVKWAGSLHADLLKVGHHGSRSSTTEGFLEHVQPKVAVISVGKSNRYGHPSSDVVQRLRNAVVQIYETSHFGHLKFVTNGDRWRREETRAEMLVRLWKLPSG